MNSSEIGGFGANTKGISIPCILSLVLALHQLSEGRGSRHQCRKFATLWELKCNVCIVAWGLWRMCSLHESVQRCFWGWGECPKRMGTRSVLEQGAENSLDSGELLSHQIMALCHNYKKPQACNSHLKWCIQQVRCFQHKLGSWTDYHMEFS